MCDAMVSEETEFQWPDDPPEDWWLAEGATRKMKPEVVRYAAVKFQYGDEDSRKNSVAARIAGLPGTRTQVFRVDRSKGVQDLLKKAREIRAGRRPRVTEEEIDRKIDDLIRAPDAQTVAKGLELRMKREAASRVRADDAGDSRDSARQLLYTIGILAAPLVAETHFALGGDVTVAPFFDLWAPFLARRFPEQWARYRAPLVNRAELFNTDEDRRYLAEFDAAGAAPELTGEEFRRAIGAVAVSRGNGAAPKEDFEEVASDAA
jgi:hypothetical protein